MSAGIHKREQIDSCVHIDIKGEPGTLDPRKNSDPASASLLFFLFEGLTHLNPDGSIAMAIAENIEIAPHGKRILFHLRESRWSDGTSVTAYDFEKSWKDILHPNFPSTYHPLLYPIKNAKGAKEGVLFSQEVGIEAKDSQTLSIELEEPNPYFLQITAFCMLFPVNRKIEQKFSDWAYHTDELFICNGPYKLAGWENQREIILKKNQKYWGAENVRVEEIHFHLQNTSFDSSKQPPAETAWSLFLKEFLEYAMHRQPIHLFDLLHLTGQTPHLTLFDMQAGVKNS